MTGLAGFVQSAGAAMGYARDAFGAGGGVFAASGAVGVTPPAPPGAGRAADAEAGDSRAVQGYVGELDTHDQAAGGQLAGAAAASGAGRGRMESIIAAAVADVHALGLATDTPQGQAALITAIKRHLEDTRATLGAAAADAGTRAAGAATTTAAYTGTAPAAAPMAALAPLMGAVSPLAGMGSAPLSMLSGFGQMGGAPMAPLATLASMTASAGLPDAAVPVEGAVLSGDRTVGAGAVRRALDQVGKPYVLGAEGPSSFDCSGLVQWAYHGVGVDLPRTTYDQIHVGEMVRPGEVKPGDLVFSNFSSPGVPEHVQMAISPTQVVEAPQPGGHVQVEGMPRNAIVKRVVA